MGRMKLFTCEWKGVEKTLCLSAWAKITGRSNTFINRHLKAAEAAGLEWNARMAFAIKQVPSEKAINNPTGIKKKAVNKDINLMAQKFSRRGFMPSIRIK